MANRINIFFFISLLIPNLVYGQTSLSNDSLKDDSYHSYYKTKISVGWQAQFQPIISKSHFTFSVAYSMSNFYYPIEKVNTQIGLSNECGLNNLEVYFKFGPEIRLLKNIFLIPEGGISFAWMAGVDRGGVGFLYYYGGRAGLIQSISKTSNLLLEFGTRVIPIDGNQIIYYASLGVFFNLF
jgi:hypothetical protein